MRFLRTVIVVISISVYTSPLYAKSLLGEEVFIYTDRPSFSTVEGIDGDFLLLSDGQWYESNLVFEIKESLNEFKVGELVKLKESSVELYLEAISANFYFLLEDGHWYHINELQRFPKSTGTKKP